MIVGSINSTGSEKNYNSGGVVATETGKDAGDRCLTPHNPATTVAQRQELTER